MLTNLKSNSKQDEQGYQAPMADFRKRNQRPDGTSMEGMVWNGASCSPNTYCCPVVRDCSQSSFTQPILALDEALRPKSITRANDKEYIDECAAIVIISIVEAGFVFSGSVGTGIMLVRLPNNGWSLPCAVGMTGVGWGLLVGASVKDMLIFVFDHQMTRAAKSEFARLRLGAQVELALGPLGARGPFESNRGTNGRRQKPCHCIQPRSLHWRFRGRGCRWGASCSERRLLWSTLQL